MKFLLAAIITATMFLGAAHADFNKGVAAYKSGDFATALREFKPLAEQGYATAQFNLGLLYRKGLQDYAEAVKWYRKAAEQGYASAQYNLGIMYRKGQGVTQDYAEAAKWFRMAAAQGIAGAQAMLGVIYTHGQGVIQDNVLAHMWSNIAGANGNENSSKLRDLIAKNLTPADISEAQRRARVCMKSKYQDCD